MTIKIGDAIPSVTLKVMGDGGPEDITTETLLKGKKVALFGLPGAFTPTCSKHHLPGFVGNSEALKGKNVDAIVCLAVNDVFVMDAWGRDQKVGDTVAMVADGDAEFTRATGLDLDLAGKGLGLRCQRFSMIVDDGVVRSLDIDPPGEFSVTSCEYMLEKL
jgi:glutaredoxin/glutathione-dependent peroxiredoxin